jgi:hypothetical protein
LKVCETKGFADAFLRKCVNLKTLGDISASFEVSRPFGGPSGGRRFQRARDPRGRVAGKKSEPFANNAQGKAT